MFISTGVALAKGQTLFPSRAIVMHGAETNSFWASTSSFIANSELLASVTI